MYILIGLMSACLLLLSVFRPLCSLVFWIFYLIFRDWIALVPLFMSRDTFSYYYLYCSVEPRGVSTESKSIILCPRIQLTITLSPNPQTIIVIIIIFLWCLSLDPDKLQGISSGNIYWIYCANLYCSPSIGIFYYYSAIARIASSRSEPVFTTPVIERTVNIPEKFTNKCFHSPFPWRRSAFIEKKAPVWNFPKTPEEGQWAQWLKRYDNNNYFHCKK